MISIMRHQVYEVNFVKHFSLIIYLVPFLVAAFKLFLYSVIQQ